MRHSAECVWLEMMPAAYMPSTLSPLSRAPPEVAESMHAISTDEEEFSSLADREERRHACGGASPPLSCSRCGGELLLLDTPRKKIPEEYELDFQE